MTHGLSPKTQWLIEDQPMQTEFRNLVTWGGGKQAPPPLRGEDLVVPHSYGDAEVVRRPGSRDMPFEGWVLGARIVDGKQEVSTAILREEWAALRRLLWGPGRRKITKQWLNDEGHMIEAHGTGVYSSGLEPELGAHGKRANFQVTYRMADPFFYSDEIRLSVRAGRRLPLEVAGDYATNRVWVELHGMLSQARLQVWGRDGLMNELQYSELGAGTVAEIDCRRYKAREIRGGASVPVLQKVTHSGAAAFLELPLDAVSLRLQAKAGDGYAVVRYQPAWI